MTCHNESKAKTKQNGTQQSEGYDVVSPAALELAH